MGPALLIGWIVLSSGTSTDASLPAALRYPDCVACQVEFADTRRSYSEQEWQQLLQGQVVTSVRKVTDAQGEASSDAIATVIVDRPPTQVWYVLTDFADHPRFTPNLAEKRILRVVGNDAVVSERLDVAFQTINIQLKLRIEPEQGLISSRLDKSVDNDLADVRSSWRIVAVPGGKTTLLRYQTWVDTGMPVPGFIEKLLTKRSLPKVVLGMKQEAERLPAGANGADAVP